MFSSIKFENTEKSEEKPITYNLTTPEITLLNIFLYLLVVLVFFLMSVHVFVCVQ